MVIHEETILSTFSEYCYFCGSVNMYQKHIYCKIVPRCANTSHGRKGGFLYKLLIAGVYLLFLAVQVFFNFDIGRKSFYSGSNVFIVNSHSQHAAGGSAKASTSAPSKSKLRLNKRFELPAEFITPDEVAQINVLPVAPVKLGSYTSRNYFSVIRSSHSRRGPPAIA